MHKKSTLLKIKKSIKVVSLVTMLMIPLSGFAVNDKDEDTKTNTKDTTEDTNLPADDNTKNDERRPELELKQRHSPIVVDKNLYADGIKIHRDLSTIKEVIENEVMGEDEIPSDDLYQGLWNNTGVKSAYRSIEQALPDTFKIDLANFSMPVIESPGHVTSNFGPRRRRMHNGIDLKVYTGDTIYAAFDGKVRVKQFERRGYGYYVVLRHSNGLETVYGHLSKFLVDEDQVVKSGDPIALGGNTGRSSGSHLHFEFRFLGKAINPAEIVDFSNKVCHRDEYLVTKKKLVSPTMPKGTPGYHRVKSGETLGAIARKYRVSVNALCKLNRITAKTTIRAGKTLRIS